jgi:uncharacterized OB-fold protein
MEQHLLPRTGTLWSFTVQGFRPKEPYIGPEDFEPYGVGYVDLHGHVIVEARLIEADVDILSIGAPMELKIVPFAIDVQGRELMTYAFTLAGSDR